MNLYYKLLFLLLNKDLYNSYIKIIDINGLKGSYPVIYKLFLALIKLHELTDKKENTPKDLETVFMSLYPQENPRETEIIFRRLETDGSLANKDLLVSYLKDSKARLLAYEIGKTAVAVADGAVAPEALKDALMTVLDDLEAEQKKIDVEFVSDDLEILYNHQVKEQGLRWRLNSLNKSLGSLRKGDFGFIFARPETGKTTFLASETSYMASCLTDDQGPILWINNEEQGEKVMLRCYQAALDLTIPELAKNLPENREKFQAMIKGKIKLFDNPGISYQEIERLTDNLQPSLIVIDQIDKVKGFDADRDDLKLGVIYQWGRELAKKHCPVIGICQADGTGEGVKALTMSHVANAKTSKQAEADFILGIGKSHSKDEEFIRYFNISKNKLFGDADSDPSLKHDFWEVEIDPQHARYRDFVYQHDDPYSR